MTAERENADPKQSEPQGQSFGDIAASIGSRNLMIAIVTMPLIFLGLVAAIITIFGRPQTDRDEKTAEQPAATMAAPTLETAPLTDVAHSAAAQIAAAGQTPGAIALDGDRLAVRLDGPDGVEIVVYDLAKGEVIARIPITSRDPD